MSYTITHQFYPRYLSIFWCLRAQSSNKGILHDWEYLYICIYILHDWEYYTYIYMCNIHENILFIYMYMYDYIYIFHHDSPCLGIPRRFHMIPLISKDWYLSTKWYTKWLRIYIYTHTYCIYIYTYYQHFDTCPLKSPIKMMVKSSKDLPQRGTAEVPRSQWASPVAAPPRNGCRTTTRLPNRQRGKKWLLMEMGVVDSYIHTIYITYYI